MVREGRADGSVSGATHTTGHTVGAALKCIGPKHGLSLYRASFMVLRDAGRIRGRADLRDCGVVDRSTAAQLRDALASADSARAVLEVDLGLRCSHSHTKGSARDPLVSKIVEATRTVRERAPQLAIDGELQADAALVPSVAHSKAPAAPSGVARTP